MKNKKLIIVLSVLFVLFSCNKKSHYAFEVREMDFVNRTGDVIDGKSIKIDIMGSDDILICDSLLLVMSLEPSGQLKVFKLTDYQLLGNFCLKGRAKNEFLHPTFLSDQWFYNKEGDLILPVVDNIEILKEINISQSIKQHSTVVLPNVSNCVPIVRGDFVLIDNDLSKRFQCYRSHENNVVVGRYCVPEYNITESDIVIKTIDVFPNLMNLVNEELSRSMYFGGLIKHPNKNIILQPLQYMDYILRFDLDNNDFYAIHQIGSLSFDDIIPDWLDKPIFNFTSSCYTTDYVILLYKSGDYSRSFPDYKNALSEILIFDWNCNYIGGAKLGKKVHDIAYDEKNMKLIGLCRGDDIVYSFDLSELMSSIKR